MAIKYVVIPEKRKTIAILEGCTLDAVHRIEKMLGDCMYGCSPKYFMPYCFKASTVCAPEDPYDIEEGKRIAKKKLMKKYYKSLDKRIKAFKNDLIDVNNRVFN